MEKRYSVEKKLKKLYAKQILREIDIGKKLRIKRVILSHRTFFSWKHLFCNFFSKDVAFTKFLLKKRESKFPQFPHCVNISCSLKGKIFRQINFTAGFTKFLLSKISIIPNHIVEIKDNFTHTFFAKISWK